MKHVVLNIFTITKLAKCKQLQFVVIKHTAFTDNCRVNYVPVPCFFLILDRFWPLGNLVNFNRDI